MKQTFFLILSSLLILSSTPTNAQKKYQSLLWKVSGNGLTKPSYLYGTMHVSEKMVFQLGDPFFNAIQDVDAVALELEPELWLESMFAGNGFYDSEEEGEFYNGRSSGLEGFFTFDTDIQSKVINVIGFEPPVLNYMLFRFDDYGGSAEFEENTWLDMYIYQTGKKLGKKTLGLETYEQSSLYGKLARKAEANEKIRKSFDQQDREKMYELQSKVEPAYRRQDLDLVDSISMTTNSPAFNKYILVERNKIFVNNIDSIIRSGASLFSAMGCAHLPGKDGVIEMLRSMGYTVEPMDKGTRDAKRRDKLDKIIYKRPYQNFQSKDGIISFDTPAKVYPISTGTEATAWLCLDIPNGANFTVYRLKSYSGFTGENIDYHMASVDSILYEAVPGDILSKKKITFQGFPAFDIISKSRRGDVQHRRIIFTPEEVFMLKVTALKDKVLNKYGDEFFNSFKINYDKKRSSMHQWAAPDQSVKAKIPGDLTFYSGETEFTITSDLEVTSFDEKTGAYYILWRFTGGEPGFLDEDDYINTTIAQQFVDDNEMDRIHEYSGSHGTYKARFGKYKSKAGKEIYGMFLHHNITKYVFTTQTADSTIAFDYFKSITLDQPTYPTFYTYKDTILHFTMSIPYDLNERHRKMDYGFNWDSEDEINEAEGVRNSIRIMPPGSPENVLVKLNRYNKYYHIKDTIKYINNLENKITEYGDLIIHQKHKKDNENGFVIDYVLRDTASSREIYHSLYLYKNSLYRLISSSDTLKGKSAFVKTAFESFQPQDTVFNRSIFSNGGISFLKDIASSDSTTQKNAILLLDEIYLREENAPGIRQMLVNLPNTEEKKDKEDIKNALLQELWRDTSDVNLDFLSAQYYANTDSASYQNKILQNLGWMNTRSATLRMKKLMLDEPPIGGKSGNSSPLNSLRDSLQLAKLIYPEAMTLSTIDEFKLPQYSLLALLADSNMIDKKIIEAEIDLILMEAKNELKRVNGTDEKSYNFSTTALMNYCKILHPVRNRPDVKAFFDKVYKSKKRAMLIDYIDFNAKHNVTTPDSILQFVTQEREFILKLYLTLQKNELVNRMPQTYHNIDTLIALYCEKKYESKYDNKGKVENVSILNTREEIIKGKPYVVYFVKFKRKREVDSRGTVFILPKNEYLWTEKPWETSSTAVLDSRENEQKKLDRVYREIVKFNRKNKYGENAYDFGSYNSWNE